MLVTGPVVTILVTVAVGPLPAVDSGRSKPGINKMFELRGEEGGSHTQIFLGNGGIEGIKTYNIEIRPCWNVGPSRNCQRVPDAVRSMDMIAMGGVKFRTD